MYHTSQMCIAIVKQHKWLFISQRLCFSSPILAKFQTIGISEMYISYTTPMGEPANVQEIGTCAHLQVVMKT